MSAIPTWVFTAVTLILLAATAIVAVKTQGGVKRPVQLLTLTIVTVVYIFSLTFVQNVKPQLGLDLRGGVSIVLAAKGNPSAAELNVAVDVIRSRVDALGVAEASVVPEGKNINVDLPGAKNAQRAEKLIGQTAQLRFREVAENSATDASIQQVLSQIYAADQAKSSKSTTTTTKPKSTTTTTAKSTTTTTAKTTTTVGSPGKSFHAAATTTSTTTTTPVTTTTTPAAYPTSLTLTCGGTNPTSVTMTGDLTHVTPREDDKADKPIIAWDKPTDSKTSRKPNLLCPAILKGNIVKTASKQVDSLGALSVGVTLTGKGGKEFTQLIGVPLGNQSVAIVLDSTVISAPVINADLANGLTNNQLQITMGSGTNVSSQVDNLVTVLKYGKLPVVLVQQTAEKVSASLGTDQLHAGLVAGAVGLILVIIYMLLYYRILALVVISGIGLTGLTTYALICWLGETQGLSLTLAGAVGLIVSLGVTVDSYVVYFEKLKDEVRQGRSIRSCLDPAFKAAFRTILAADFVSLLGGVTLFELAAGSVRGFAFFLIMSTVLDLLISVCFMHPMVKLLTQKKSLITNKRFGFAAALDKKDLTV